MKHRNKHIQKTGGINKIRLWSFILFLFFVIVGGLVVILPVSFSQVALALSGDYTNKNMGDSITADEWNYLDEDFVKKEGDTMTGPLIVPNLTAANLINAPNLAAGSINTTDLNVTGTCTGCGGGGGAEDTSGDSLRVVCGQTAQGATSWEAYSGNVVTVWVDTSGASFSSAPIVFTSLGGNNGGNQYNTIGVNNIYNPEADGFRVYVTYLPGGITPDQVNTWGWHVNWCVVGN